MFDKCCFKVKDEGCEFQANWERGRGVTWSPWFCSGYLHVKSFTGRKEHVRLSNPSTIIQIMFYISPSFVHPPQGLFTHKIIAESWNKKFWEVDRRGLSLFGWWGERGSGRYLTQQVGDKVDSENDLQPSLKFWLNFMACIITTRTFKLGKENRYKI